MFVLRLFVIFICLSRSKFWQLNSTDVDLLYLPTHTLTKDLYPQHRELNPLLFSISIWVLERPTGKVWYGRYL